MNTPPFIIGLRTLNLKPEQEDYLRQCVSEGKFWFVTRKSGAFRTIQATGETQERVMRTYNGWKGHHCPAVVEIRNNKVYWHTPK